MLHTADQVENGHVVIEHCPMENMIGDYYTKHLQGKKFEEFRRLIMGMLTLTRISDSQQCVGSTTNNKEKHERSYKGGSLTTMRYFKRNLFYHGR